MNQQYFWKDFRMNDNKDRNEFNHGGVIQVLDSIQNSLS